MTRILPIALVTLGDPGSLTGGYLYHRRMAELAGQHRAGIAFVSFPQRPFPLAALAAREVLRRVRQTGAEVMVLDSIAAAFLAPALLRPPPDPPMVAMLHQPPGGIDHGPVRTAVQAVLDRRAYAAATCLLVASAALREQLVASGVSPHRIRLVPPGRDVAKIAQGEAGDLRAGRRAAFLCVANWVERKGILNLLDALALLPNDLATLHLVGEDRPDTLYAQRVRGRLRRPDLADRVVVHGPVSRERVAALYRAADVFVLPSIREPYGTVYGEAMAAGLPVTGWRAGNLPHLAQHEVEGLLAEPGDVAGLSRAMERLALDAGLRRRLGEAAARRSEGRPTWSESAELFFGAIHSVAEGSWNQGLRARNSME